MALLPSCDHFRDYYYSSRRSMGRRYHTGQCIETLDETNTAAWMEEYDNTSKQPSFAIPQLISAEY